MKKNLGKGLEEDPSEAAFEEAVENEDLILSGLA